MCLWVLLSPQGQALGGLSGHPWADPGLATHALSFKATLFVCLCLPVHVVCPLGRC